MRIKFVRIAIPFLALSVTLQLQSEAIQLQSVATGLSSPVFVTSAKDGTARLFIVEQPGTIKVLQPGATTPTLFLSITNKVLAGGERGLLGLTFHPDFAVNRRFFVNYTRKPDGATVIAQYRVSSSNMNVANTAEKVFLVIPQPFDNHNGGWIDFGHDGFLYAAMGDGGMGNDPGNRAQNINELLGKILRINVDQGAGGKPYSSPSTNPFFGTTPGRDEIFAVGFRNPWRDSFDRETGDLLVGDVGQGAREEVDIVTLGGNYGWRVFEGSLCTGNDPGLCNPNNYLLPIAEYNTHDGGRCAITGGYVYRGARGALPDGVYICADFCTGEILQLNPPAPGSPLTLLLGAPVNISSFGEDEAGELYVVGLGGTVQRIVAALPAPPPCSFSIAPATQTFVAAGGAGSFSLTTTGDCAWMVASRAKWVTITSAKKGVGSATVTFSVAANTTGSSRKGKITIAGKTFTVKQNR